MTAYPDVHRRTTQRPRLQETSATPGIAVQSTPTGENASKGVMQPPPAHDTVSSCNHAARVVSTRRNTLTALEIVLGVDALPGFARPAPLLRDSARGVTALTHPAPGRRSVVRRCRTLFRSYGDGAGAGRLALAAADGVRTRAGAVPHGVEHEAVPTGVAANVVGSTDGDSVVQIYAGAAVSGNLEVFRG